MKDHKSRPVLVLFSLIMLSLTFQVSAGEGHRETESTADVSEKWAGALIDWLQETQPIRTRAEAGKANSEREVVEPTDIDSDSDLSSFVESIFR